MAKPADKIRLALDETRMLVLVVQVLIGFESRAALEPGFDRLPASAQYVKLACFILLLISLAFLLSVPATHRLSYDGEANPRFVDLVKTLMAVALLPFALALGGAISIAAYKLWGGHAAVLVGVLASGAALTLWYGLGLIRHHQKPKETLMPETKSEPVSLDTKIQQVLTEARIVLPGAQALLGFQLVAFLTDSFDKLPRASQTVHFVSLALIAITALLLMTPATYHRIGEDGEESEHFLRIASRFVVIAMIPLGIGITGDFYVVLNKILKAQVASAVCAALLLSLYIIMWFVLPLMRARVKKRRELVLPSA